VILQYDRATPTQVTTDALVAAFIASGAILSAAEAKLVWLQARKKKK
jgi:hypothetical protein